VEVWRQRQIFEAPIQDAIEARIEELDKNRSSGKRGLMDGGSIFSKNTGSIPNELAPLVAPQQMISKLGLSTRTSVSAANSDYDKLTDPSAVTPSAPVHAARLNGLLKTLANAEGAVAESIKARKALIEGLEKILDTNRTALATEESQLTELSSRRAAIDAKKRDVEDSIMRGFASNSNPGTPTTPGQTHTPTTPAPEPDRPEVEALTPPSYETLSPNEPTPEPGNQGTNHHTDNSGTGLTLDAFKADSTSPISISPPLAAPGSDLLSSLSSSYGMNGTGNSKKRKIQNDGDEFPDLGGDAMDGIDDDVAEMLRNDVH